MFVMISAILLAWAPTTAYAGDPLNPVTITTEDRKGMEGLDEPCGNESNVFNISIRGGEYTLDSGTPEPIPKGTSDIRVTFDSNNSAIERIKFIKHNGFVALDLMDPALSSIQIDAKIANNVVCGLAIPKGTTSLTLTSVAD